MHIRQIIDTYLHFHFHFVGKPGQAGSPFFLHCFRRESLGQLARVFLRARRPYCHRTNSVKALQETESTGQHQCHGPTILHPSQDSRWFGIAPFTLMPEPTSLL